ncbi:DNA polymerase III, subunit gamma and tau [Rubidibacter lacunae KORDI 51-2]|uniref:DNA polymerase III subunit gamma/tau n=1 Tax=Rubidibacter lacunae KORDI 51-2 TaxID=582515 RepID=U5DD73_9CHRO|nr:DNA polymerase III subunit gamma/tau [Rubidibacter lacunae]ERN42463.1 DNA polymerase III, subunit gamma and tau [Rubidibacter lacunae KORDI 51-2]
MTYEPLHHKYRPQTFADLVGQDAIATTLANAIATERIAPAYLFAGPRGTGKTSSARIFAKSLNCLSGDRPTTTPCGRCEACQTIARGTALDAIEIDAASNTGVDNIRELIERAQFAPVLCRYKVYLIDEVHMLSAAAFNALLKTLEEPPSRVVFILATTDPQRVLPTIISRCQRFDFRRIPLAAMVTHLGEIARREQIAIAPEALTLVAQVADGGMRDAESLLDQLSLLSGTVTPQRVWDLVGAIPERDLLALLRAIRTGAIADVLAQSRHLLDRGREPLTVLHNLAGFYRDLLIAKTAPQHANLVALTTPTWEQLIAEADRWTITDMMRGQQVLRDGEPQLRHTTQPRLWLEVTLLGLLERDRQPVAPTAEPTVVSQERPEPAPAVVPRDRKPPLQAAQSRPRPDTAPTPPTPSRDRQPSTPTAEPQGRTASAPPAASDRPLPVTVSQPAATELPSPSPAPTPTAYPAVWKQVIESLPRFTQALLRQQCHPIGIDFDRSIALIGVSSKGILAQAENRKAALEEAFTRACECPFKVQFVIDAEPKPTEKVPVDRPPADLPAQTAAIAPSPPPDSQTLVSKPTAPELSALPIETQAPSVPANETQPSGSKPTDADIDRAARSLASAFNGEVLPDMPLPESPAAEQLDLTAVAGNSIDLEIPADAADTFSDEVPF